jgi:hypothetical protein
LQGHFCEAVNNAAAHSAGRAKPEGLRQQGFLRILYQYFHEKARPRAKNHPKTEKIFPRSRNIQARAKRILNF